MVTENCKKIEPVVVKLCSKTNIPLFSEHSVVVFGVQKVEVMMRPNVVKKITCSKMHLSVDGLPSKTVEFVFISICVFVLCVYRLID